MKIKTYRIRSRVSLVALGFIATLLAQMAAATNASAITMRANKNTRDASLAKQPNPRAGENSVRAALARSDRAREIKNRPSPFKNDADEAKAMDVRSTSASFDRDRRKLTDAQRLGGGTCQSDSDCTNNQGRCVGGKCECWGGYFCAHCEESCHVEVGLGWPYCTNVCNNFGGGDDGQVFRPALEDISSTQSGGGPCLTGNDCGQWHGACVDQRCECYEGLGCPTCTQGEEAVETGAATCPSIDHYIRVAESMGIDPSEEIGSSASTLRGVHTATATLAFMVAAAVWAREL